MSNDDLFEQACAWHYRLLAEDADIAERAAFFAWLSGGEARGQAWDEVQVLLGALREPASSVYAAQRRSPRRSGWVRWASAAVLLLAIVFGTVQTPWLDRLRADQSTGVGESRLLDLVDGSRLQLNTDTAVRIDLGVAERRIRLLRGEAWFEVSKDANRPFFVESGEGWVKVVGTRFSVARRGDETFVRVASGRVSVSGDGQSEPVLLEPRRAVEYRSGRMSEVHALDPTLAFAWRQRQLVFRQQPLGEVVAELSRYWPGHVLIMDQELKHRRISGVFEIDKPEAVLRALQLTLGLRVERYTPYLMLLRAAEEPARP